MSNIKELENIPEAVFTDRKSLEEIREEILADYAKAYEELTGQVPNLGAADPIRLICNALALRSYHAKLIIEDAGRQNLLKYSTGDNLRNLGALKKITIKPAGFATAILKFSMDDVRSEATSIPGGTRVTTDNDIVFSTNEYAEIPIGSMFVEVYATSEIPGIICNGLSAGALSTMMDPLPYISNVSNISETSGGSDIEDDDSLTRRIFLAPNGYSVAGPEGAYISKALEMDGVIDAKSISPNPCCITLVFLMKDGKIPTDIEKSKMEKHMNDKSVRPQGDRLTIVVPVEVNYNISLTYYISKSDVSKESQIKLSVQKSIGDYVKWQRRLGLSINPSELIHRIRSAGAKRCEITEPQYISIDSLKIGKMINKTVTYGGVEND